MKWSIAHLEAAFRLGLEFGRELGQNRERKLNNDIRHTPGKFDKEYHQQRQYLEKRYREIEDEFELRRWWPISMRQNFRKWREKLETEAIERNKARLSGKRYRPKKGKP